MPVFLVSTSIGSPASPLIAPVPLYFILCVPGEGPPRSRRALLPGPKPSTLHGADINQRPGCDRVSNVVITRVNDIHYPVTLDALHTIFSVYGVIDKIVTFDKGGGFQALIQYQTTQPAIDAYDALDDQQMYEGCNLLRIGYSNLTDITVKHNCERSWDYRTNGMPPSGRFKRAASDSATSLNQRERGLKRDNHNSHGSGRENSSSTPRQQQQQQSAGAHTENSHVCHSCGQPGHIAKHCPMGTGIDRPLMVDDGFLAKYAFPTESSLNAETAPSVYSGAIGFSFRAVVKRVSQEYQNAEARATEHASDALGGVFG